jgi:septin 2
VGFANLPNQVHRKYVKKGFEFTLMVVGESGLGKSTLINSLFLTDLYPEKSVLNSKGNEPKLGKTVNIEASTVEIEERGVKLRLTIVDTPGFGDSVNCGDSYQPIIKYIDDQFERFLNDESGLNRRNISDNRAHCCFYFIAPWGHGLKPLDIECMKALQSKVNIIPIIAKADTLTASEVKRLKIRILNELHQNSIQIYKIPDCDSDEDEEFKIHNKQLKDAMPFAVVGSNSTIEVRGKKVRGRLYPWGVVEIENIEHNDFVKLRTMLITHMQDLQEVTHEIHYENYRSEKLGPQPFKKNNHSVKDSVTNGAGEIVILDHDKMLKEKEEELRKMQEMVAKMQAQMLQAQLGEQNKTFAN